MTLPFAKHMPFWNQYETEEAYKTFPQNPHFSPLLEVNEDHRELVAVGLMESFYSLLRAVKDLRLDDPSSKIRSIRSSFAKLEMYGFDVATPGSRIDKVLSLQDARAKNMEERKCLENKIEAQENDTRKLEEEMVESERNIMELKRQEAARRLIMEDEKKMIVERKPFEMPEEEEEENSSRKRNLEETHKVEDVQVKKLKEEVERLQKTLEASKTQKHKLEKEQGELEHVVAKVEEESDRNILKLKHVVAKLKRSAAKLILALKSCVETIDQVIAHIEQEFTTTVLAPW
ncbi:PREDICTED: DUF724 domain-containing protein 3-like [Camelina sativa]|uniref:DUF724 domain-containing protein 3-like n=1 Tax=Camelina sativa TaxID=90675 RepID=A0ABM0VY52_CAMSA|nr:PREDICTED: DUF724 domain-containing protein 3-like [Camelina sativa]